MSQETLSRAWEVLQDAYQAQVATNETALAGVRAEAATGERTVQDVLLAEHTLFTSRVKLVQAQHDGLAARFALMAAVGRLDAPALGLDVPRFDPRDYYRHVRFGPGR